ncbi:ATP-binding protein [Roseitranquillus sediminis]|uniref:ATP-binding protein n=1 Tax=Roseitranquillus sediminis TaxID=2809051 RepID=UPI001D0C5CFF|nr:ATP-binding protein [Roseitranquillus sediminis]MBM9594984.1 ATP-binding protein [Roseitranquillus sediminis]
MNVAAGQTRAPLGFQPELRVDDRLAAHWLAQSTLRLRREIAWLWHERAPQGAAHEPGVLPPANDALSTALDLGRHDADRHAFFAADPTAAWLSGRIAEPAPTAAAPARGSFGWLARELGLSEVDCLALALALGGVVDSARGSVVSACLDGGASEPTLSLLQRLWDAPHEAIDLLDPAHPLVAHGLLDPAPTGWDSPLRVAPSVAAQLLFSPPAPRGLRPVPPAAKAGEDLELPVARLKTRATDRASVVPISGTAGAPRAETAAAIARSLGMALVEPTGAANAAALASAMVTAWLRGDALFLPFVAAAELPLARLSRLPLVIFVGMDDGDPVAQLPRQVTLARVRLAPASYDERLACWRRELPAVWAGEVGRRALTECARRFRYEGRTISRIAAAVRALEHPPEAHDLFAACRADLDLGDLAQPVAPRFDLDELMLPARQAEQVRQIVAASAALTRVHHEWGTARAWNESGLSALFAGPPGTGKTMAAEAIARAVDMPIYRIDLSQVVNKYIGETEKNLRRLFDAADAADVILFFDEADALFGKRTEVKDAHDRYANLEVSYLLERMERFKGMAILATNRKKDLDEAFMRRLRYMVQFPLPGPEERLRIWQAVLPAGVDTSDLDLRFLADRIPLSGGHIRSAVFNACLQSAREGEAPVLAMPAVVRAVKDEFDKLGRAVSLDQFGRYGEHLRE